MGSTIIVKFFPFFQLLIKQLSIINNYTSQHPEKFLFIDSVASLNLSVQPVGKLLPYFKTDREFGERKNRKLLKEVGVRSSFKPLGRKGEMDQKDNQWFKNKYKERNKIKRHFYASKQHNGMNRVRYSIENGS